MADEWDKYAVTDSTQSPTQADEWSQYAQKPETVSPSSTSPQEAFTNYLAQGIGAGVGVGAVGLASRLIPPAVRATKMIPTAASTPKSADFAQQVRSAFVQAHTEKVNEFAKAIDDLSQQNPDRVVDLRNTIRDIQDNWDGMTNEARSVIKKTPVLNKMVNDLWDKKATPMATDVSLKQAQEISNYMNTKLPKNIRYNNLDIIDTLNNVRGAQLDAFPEMEQARSAYKTFIQPYNNVKQYFKFNKLLSSIQSKFGGAEGQQAVEQVLPKEVIKKLGGYRVANEIVSLAKNPLGIIGKMLGTAHGFALGTIDPAMMVTQQEMGGTPQEVLDAVMGKKLSLGGIPENYQNQIMAKQTFEKMLAEEKLKKQIQMGGVI